MEFIIGLSLISISLSSEFCHENCKTCLEDTKEFINMKCITCNENLSLIFNTSICDSKRYYPDYYLNKTDSILYPCSLLENQNCYECDPYLNTKGKCVSCGKGYILNSETNECQTCKENEIPIVKGDFYGCKENINYTYCNLFKTECFASKNTEIICPDEAPIYDIIKKSCNEYESQENGFENGLCIVKNKKYKDRILFINWFINKPLYFTYPSYNVDNSGYLLIELGSTTFFEPYRLYSYKTKNRKLYFLNEEGRGLFDDINDICEKVVNLSKGYYRFFSTSIALKSNDSDEYNYFLNFENSFLNMEFINIKTGEISADIIFDIFELFGNKIKNIVIPSIQLMELRNKNQYLFSSYAYSRDSKGNYLLFMLYDIFSLNISNKKKINIYSLKKVYTHAYVQRYYLYNENMKFFFIQTKKGKLLNTEIEEPYKLHVSITNTTHEYFNVELFEDAFHKLLNIKDEINLLCFKSRLLS